MRYLTIIALLAAIPAIAACEEKDAEKGGGGGAVSTKLKDALTLADSFANQLIKGVQQSRTTLIQGVYGATRMARTGKITNTGTLTLVAGGQWIYQPAPADKLVIKAGPLVQEFVVLGAQGNMNAADAETWIGSNHTLKYRHKMKDVFDVEVSDTSRNGRFAFTLKGTAYYNKKPFQADLKAEGSYFFQRDLAGYDNKAEYKLQGTLTGKDAKVLVDEEHKFRLLAAQSPSRRPGVTRTTGGGSRVVSYSDDIIRNKLTLGSDQYVWKARFVTDFINGKVPPTQPTAWRCGGTITRNGKKWGQYKMDATGRRVHGKVVGNVRMFVLVTPEGKTILRHFS